MKKVLLSVMFLICGITSFGQTAEENVVRRFGGNLRDWCSTKNINFRKSAQDQCIDACRVVDKIMEDYARNNGVRIKDYVIPNYLNCFQEAMGKGSVNINILNLRTIRSDEQAYSLYGESTIEQERQRSKEVVTIACEIAVNGVLDYNVKDVYYVRRGRILKILPYEEETDQRTGKKKVKVDFSDLVDEHSIEVSYGYSSHFPLNIGVSTNFSLFNIGVEYGMNFSEDQLQTKKHTNFATSTLERGKYWYLMATPGVYLRYASIDCGLGNVFAKYNYIYESVYTSSSNSEKKNYFIMKPKLTFHIPFPLDFSSRTEKIYISPHVGYQYVPKCSALNCWEVGIGVRFRFETY